jgi:hypothetical protein
MSQPVAVSPYARGLISPDQPCFRRPVRFTTSRLFAAISARPVPRSVSNTATATARRTRTDTGRILSSEVPVSARAPSASAITAVITSPCVRAGHPQRVATLPLGQLDMARAIHPLLHARRARRGRWRCRQHSLGASRRARVPAGSRRPRRTRSTRPRRTSRPPGPGKRDNQARRPETVLWRRHWDSSCRQDCRRITFAVLPWAVLLDELVRGSQAGDCGGHVA